MPEYHVKIESFDERLITMSSLRRPKCITIRGNDQKEHKFMVKGGEDQRQDERIETLFELINELLKSDPKCYQRNLSLRTYQVIPMTSKLALIEWMPNTRTLKDVIFGPMTDSELEQMGQSSPEEAYGRYINRASKNAENYNPYNINDIYGKVFAKYKRDYVCHEFNEIQKKVPWDLLRRSIRSMSFNSEGSISIIFSKLIMSMHAI
jgi:DNA-dependent protein kinase catalytic subunit